MRVVYFIRTISQNKYKDKISPTFYTFHSIRFIWRKCTRGLSRRFLQLGEHRRRYAKKRNRFHIRFTMLAVVEFRNIVNINEFIYSRLCVTVKLVFAKLVEEEEIIPGIYMYNTSSHIYIYWFYAYTCDIKWHSDMECFAFFQYHLRRISIEKSR